MTRAHRLSHLLLCGVFLFGCDDKAKPASEESKKADASPTTPKIEPLPKLDADGAAKAVEAIAGASEEMQGKLAAVALAELEVQRLGPSFVAGLNAMAQAAPDQRAMLVAKSIQENIDMLDLACEADGAKTMGSLGSVDVTQRQAVLWDSCKFEKLGLISKDVGMKSDGISAILAHMAFAKLKKHGATDPNERKLLELLATAKEEEEPPPPAGE